MHGVTIRRRHDGPVVRRAGGASVTVATVGDTSPALQLDQLTDFVEFFGGSLGSQRSACWLLEDVVFCTPRTWLLWYDSVADRYRGPRIDEFEAGFVAAREDLRFARSGFVETYGRYVVDDWCSIIGLSAEPAEPAGFLASLPMAPTPRQLEEFRPEVTVAFFCVDGVFWDAFARDRAFIDSIEESLSHREDLIVREQSVETSYGC